MTLSNGIAGVDEVGRGALAGPVVAAACVLDVPLVRFRKHSRGWHPKGISNVRIADSKMLSPEERERTFVWLLQHAQFNVGVVSQSDVDERGIIRSTELAMQQAITQLSHRLKLTGLLVDGRDHFHFSVPHKSIIRGDQLEPCIAAASIAAKVVRDQLMIRAGSVFPHYGFAQHKGYGSGLHQKAILEHGPCILHRRSFLRILDDQPALF